MKSWGEPCFDTSRIGSLLLHLAHMSPGSMWPLTLCSEAHFIHKREMAICIDVGKLGNVEQIYYFYQVTFWASARNLCLLASLAKM